MRCFLLIVVIAFASATINTATRPSKRQKTNDDSPDNNESTGLPRQSFMDLPLVFQQYMIDRAKFDHDNASPLSFANILLKSSSPKSKQLRNFFMKRPLEAKVRLLVALIAVIQDQYLLDMTVWFFVKHKMKTISEHAKQHISPQMLEQIDAYQNNALDKGQVVEKCIEFDTMVRDGFVNGNLNYLSLFAFASSHLVDLSESKALFYAVHWNDVKLARFLLDYGADPNIEDIISQRPIDFAIRNRSVEMVELLLKRGADPNGKGLWLIESPDVYGFNIYQVPPIFMAALIENEQLSIQISELLIQFGAHVGETFTHQSLLIIDPPSDDHKSLSKAMDNELRIFFGIPKDELPLIDLLTPIETTFSLYEPSVLGIHNIPLELAYVLLHDHPELTYSQQNLSRAIYEHLSLMDDDLAAAILNSPHCQYRCIESALVYGVRFLSVQIIEDALDRGANPNTTVSVLETSNYKEPKRRSNIKKQSRLPLILFAMKSSAGKELEIVKLLDKYHVDTVSSFPINRQLLDVVDFHKILTPLTIHLTPLQYAVLYHRTAIVTYLLKNGGDCHQLALNGWTLFHLAVISHSSHNGDQTDSFSKIKFSITLEVLYETCGLELANQEDDQGFTPLLLAIRYDLNKQFKVLVDFPVDILKQTRAGSAALLSALHGNLLALVLLQKKGLNLHAPVVFNEKSTTLLHIASKFNQQHICKYLLQEGLNPNSRDEDGSTPLSHAITNKFVNIVSLLLEYGADSTAALFDNKSVRIRKEGNRSSMICSSRPLFSGKLCLPSIPILKRLHESVKLSPPKLRIDGKLKRSNEELWQDMVGIRSRLVDLGSGDRIGILTKNPYQTAVSQLAAWSKNLVVVPLHYNAPIREIEYFCSDAQLKTLLVSLDLAHISKKLRVDTIPLELSFPCLPSVSDISWTHHDSSDPSIIIYTSGTTGRPKGVVHSHASVSSSFQILSEAWNISGCDTLLHSLPMHHVHGNLVAFMTSLYAGANVCYVDMTNKEWLEEWINLLETSTLWMATPSHYARVLNFMRTLSGEGVRKLRLCVSGSAPMPSSLAEQWYHEVDNSKTILERYGMTETNMILSNPYRGKRHLGTVGRPLPGVEVRLLDDERNVVTGLNQKGEVQVKSPCLFKEYWKRPEATQETFTEDGWFKTGDIGIKLLPEGETEPIYKLLGRKSSDIIKSKGYKISALEIESMLMNHPHIQDVCVVGIQGLDENDTSTETIIALVVARNAETNANELQTWLKTRLSSYKIPKLFKFLPSLPRNAMGKVNKKEIQRKWHENEAK